MFVFTTALAVVFGGYTTTLRAQERAEMVSRARHYAEQKLAELRAGELVPGGPDEGGFPDREDFEWTIDFEQTTVADLYRVSIDIYWMEGRSDLRSLGVHAYHYYESPETGSS